MGLLTVKTPQEAAGFGDLRVYIIYMYIVRGLVPLYYIGGVFYGVSVSY